MPTIDFLSSPDVTPLLGRVSSLEKANGIPAVTANVAQLATGGSGTYASPYIGWFTGIDSLCSTNNGNCTFKFPAGVYLVPNTANFGRYINCTFLGQGAATVLLSTGGSGVNVFTFSCDRETTEAAYHRQIAFGIKASGFMLDGNGTAAVGLYVRNLAHCNFSDIFCRSVTDYYSVIDFSVLNKFDNLHFTTRTGNRAGTGFPSVIPANGMLVRGDGVDNVVQDCQFMNLAVESTAGVGLNLDKVVGCTFSGSIESNGGGNLVAGGNSRNNIFFGMDNEATNTGSQVSVDVDDSGVGNSYFNLIAPGTVNIRGKNTQIFGGELNKLIVQAGAKDTKLFGVKYNFLGTGFFHDFGTRTAWFGAPYDTTADTPDAIGVSIAGQGKFGGGVILPTVDGTKNYLATVANDGSAVNLTLVSSSGGGGGGGSLTNYALVSAGASITASSYYDTRYAPDGVINGVRFTNGHFGVSSDGGWAASARTFPQYLDIDFGASRTIKELDFITIGNPPDTYADPADTLTFDANGVTAFDFKYWNGTAWIPTGVSITGNNKVLRQFTSAGGDFTQFTTTKIRLNITDTIGSALPSMKSIEARG